MIQKKNGRHEQVPEKQHTASKSEQRKLANDRDTFTFHADIQTFKRDDHYDITSTSIMHIAYRSSTSMLTKVN